MIKTIIIIPENNKTVQQQKITRTLYRLESSGLLLNLTKIYTNNNS